MKGLRDVIVALLVVTAGCSGYRPPVYTPQAYPIHRQFSQLSFDWKLSRESGAIHLEGFVRNINYERFRDLVLTVSALDAKGRTVGEATWLFPKVLIAIGDAVPFTLNIPVAVGSMPATLLFVSRYRPNDREAVETVDSQSFTYALP